MRWLFCSLFVLVFQLSSIAQESDVNIENNIQFNYLHDYIECDVAVYGVVSNCEILDTMGMYTRQLVTIEVKYSFKQKLDTVIQFFDFVESYRPLYAYKDTLGFFLIEYRDTKNITHYSKIENSGFSDYRFIDSIDKSPTLLAYHLQKLTTTYDDEYKPIWIKVKPVEDTQLDINHSQNVVFQIEEGIPKWNLKKGTILQVNVWSSAYSYYHNHKKLFNNQSYFLPLELLLEENAQPIFSTPSKFILDKW